MTAGLSFQRSGNGNGGGDGIDIVKAKIVAIEDFSGQTPRYMKEPCDIGIKATLDIGRSFQPEFPLGEKFERDPQTNAVIGWGNAWQVRDFLATLGYTGALTEDQRFPAGVLESCIGKEFMRLSYVTGVRDNGKINWREWRVIGPVAEGAEPLRKKFLAAVARGSVKNYHPEAGREDAAAAIPVDGAEETPF